MKRFTVPRIALLVDTSTGWGRGIVKGVISYADSHGPWDFFVRPSGVNETLRIPASWEGNGVIARVISQSQARHLANLKLPVVNVSSTEYGRDFYRVTHDNHAVVEMAIEHFANRGIRSFGYYGAPRKPYSLARQELFLKSCESRNFECQIYSPSRSYGGKHSKRSRLTAWLRQLPHTTGIMTWGVERGVEVINAACAAGLQVPDQIAVLGGDDDELICKAVRPSLSGIHFAAEQIGYEAGRMLDNLLVGKHPSSSQLIFKPAKVTARASTDVLAIRDRDVAAAVRYIRENIRDSLKLSKVAKAITAAPRSLQRGFQRELRHSFSDEVANARIECVKHLLAESDWSMPQVAAACGYGSPEYMATAFRKSTGITPRTYRQQTRGLHSET